MGIEQELSMQSPEHVKWYIEDISQRALWEDKISSKVTDLVNYFATTNGKIFIEVLQTAMDMAEENKCVLKIHNL